MKFVARTLAAARSLKTVTSFLNQGPTKKIGFLKVDFFVLVGCEIFTKLVRRQRLQRFLTNGPISNKNSF